MVQYIAALEPCTIGLGLGKKTIFGQFELSVHQLLELFFRQCVFHVMQNLLAVIPEGIDILNIS